MNSECVITIQMDTTIHGLLGRTITKISSYFSRDLKRTLPMEAGEPLHCLKVYLHASRNAALLKIFQKHSPCMCMCECVCVCFAISVCVCVSERDVQIC